MPFPANKSKIVCTIGPASDSPEILERMIRAVKPKDRLFLNDGLIQLEVENVDGNDVHCNVLVGGELHSRKGLNLPGIELGISAFTQRDHECLEFAMQNGVDAVGQSFVDNGCQLPAENMSGPPIFLRRLSRVRARTSGRLAQVVAKLAEVPED